MEKGEGIERGRSFYQAEEFFNFTSDIERKVEFTVYSINGKVVSSGSFFSPFLWKDVKPKSAGTYIVRFLYGDSETSKKFIVLE